MCTWTRFEFCIIYYFFHSTKNNMWLCRNRKKAMLLSYHRRISRATGGKHFSPKKAKKKNVRNILNWLAFKAKTFAVHIVIQSYRILQYIEMSSMPVATPPAQIAVGHSYCVIVKYRLCFVTKLACLFSCILWINLFKHDSISCSYYPLFDCRTSCENRCPSIVAAASVYINISREYL